MHDCLLFTVRPGDGTFGVVASTARQALVHIQEMIGRGLEDASVTDLDGKRYELAELERMVETHSSVDAG